MANQQYTAFSGAHHPSLVVFRIYEMHCLRRADVGGYIDPKNRDGSRDDLFALGRGFTFSTDPEEDVNIHRPGRNVAEESRAARGHPGDRTPTAKPQTKGALTAVGVIMEPRSPDGLLRQPFVSRPAAPLRLPGRYAAKGQENDNTLPGTVDVADLTVLACKLLSNLLLFEDRSFPRFAK